MKNKDRNLQAQMSNIKTEAKSFTPHVHIDQMLMKAQEEARKGVEQSLDSEDMQYPLTNLQPSQYLNNHGISNFQKKLEREDSAGRVS